MARVASLLSCILSMVLTGCRTPNEPPPARGCTCAVHFEVVEVTVMKKDRDCFRVIAVAMRRDVSEEDAVGELRAEWGSAFDYLVGTLNPELCEHKEKRTK